MATTHFSTTSMSDSSISAPILKLFPCSTLPNRIDSRSSQISTENAVCRSEKNSSNLSTQHKFTEYNLDDSICPLPGWIRACERGIISTFHSQRWAEFVHNETIIRCRTPLGLQSRRWTGFYSLSTIATMRVVILTIVDQFDSMPVTLFQQATVHLRRTILKVEIALTNTMTPPIIDGRSFSLLQVSFLRIIHELAISIQKIHQKVSDGTSSNLLLLWSRNILRVSRCWGHLRTLSHPMVEW